jgi:hypothetical protein
MVYDLVYGCYPLQVPPHPLGDTVHSSDLRLGNRNCQLDNFDMSGGWGLLCIHDGGGCYLLLPFFVKRKKM